MTSKRGQPTFEEATNRRLIEQELKGVQSSGQLLRRLQLGRQAEEMADEEVQHQAEGGGANAPANWQDAFVLLQQQMAALMLRLPEPAAPDNADPHQLNQDNQQQAVDGAVGAAPHINVHIPPPGVVPVVVAPVAAPAVVDQPQGPTAKAYLAAVHQRDQVRAQAVLDNQPPDLMLSIVYATRQILTEDPPKFDMEQGAKAFDAGKR